jgi:hypothetical protein
MMQNFNGKHMPSPYVLRVLIMEAVRTSETSVCWNETAGCYITEDCHLHYLCCIYIVLIMLVYGGVRTIQ